MVTETGREHGQPAPDRERLWCDGCRAWVPEFTWDYHAPHGDGAGGPDG